MRFVDIIIIIFLLQSQSSVSAPLILVVVSSSVPLNRLKVILNYRKYKIRYNYIRRSQSSLSVS